MTSSPPLKNQPPLPGRLQSVEVLLTPADFGALPARDLGETTCVVFDILRATTAIITALHHGAAAVIPVAEISEALAIRAHQPDVLLAGERNGLRIRAAQTGGIDFDFGNSPREFTPERVRGRTIVTTTTNGTRALRSCAPAQTTLVASFLNLGAVADWICRHRPRHLLAVCSGTLDQAAYEDLLAAGALLELLAARMTFTQPADTVHVARQLWQLARADLLGAVSSARNAARLLRIPELAEDVPFSLQQDIFPLVAALTPDGAVQVLVR